MSQSEHFSIRISNSSYIITSSWKAKFSCCWNNNMTLQLTKCHKYADWFFPMPFTEKVPRRAILGVMMFLACMFSYVIRTNLSISIVAMVNVTSKGGNTGPACAVTDLKSNESELKDVSCMDRPTVSIQMVLSIADGVIKKLFFTKCRHDCACVSVWWAFRVEPTYPRSAAVRIFLRCVAGECTGRAPGREIRRL